MSSGPTQRPDRNRRGWVIAGLAALVLILLLVIWGMRPGRQGQPGQPGQPAHEVKAAPALVIHPLP